MTHNFPSLKERTKMLSFFIVTSSWQSGEMTLLNKHRRQSRGQMRWHFVCVCVCVCEREKDSKVEEGKRVSEYESVTKLVTAKGHADGLQYTLSDTDKQESADEE